jgi:hypothetical protein
MQDFQTLIKPADLCLCQGDLQQVRVQQRFTSGRPASGPLNPTAAEQGMASLLSSQWNVSHKLFEN